MFKEQIGVNATSTDQINHVPALAAPSSRSRSARRLACLSSSSRLARSLTSAVSFVCFSCSYFAVVSVWRMIILGSMGLGSAAACLLAESSCIRFIFSSSILSTSPIVFWLGASSMVRCRVWFHGSANVPSFGHPSVGPTRNSTRNRRRVQSRTSRRLPLPIWRGTAASARRRSHNGTRSERASRAAPGRDPWTPATPGSRR